jgi:hypothetical protein
MPSDYGLRFYDYQAFFPILKERNDGRKEEFIPASNFSFLRIPV